MFKCLMFEQFQEHFTNQTARAYMQYNINAKNLHKPEGGREEKEVEMKIKHKNTKAL